MRENIFDGCAVLMRRLEEVLLILSYAHLKIEAASKDGTEATSGASGGFSVPSESIRATDCNDWVRVRI